MAQSLRIVLHPNSLSLHVLHRLGWLERNLAGQDVRVEWIRIAGGARTPDYLAADLADFGGTGSTPPITGQGNGVPLVYVAATHKRDFGGIAVRDDSPVRQVEDLAGKSISHSGGSWHQTLIATALERAGLAWNRVVPIDLPEETSRASLLAGKVDAWASGELVGGNVEGARFIVRTGEVFANRFVFFARRGFAERHPGLLQRAAASLDEAEQWIGRNIDAAAAHLAEALSRDSPDQWRALLSSRRWGLVEVDAGVLDEQQQAAAVLRRAGLIARDIDVRDAAPVAPLRA